MKGGAASLRRLGGRTGVAKLACRAAQHRGPCSGTVPGSTRSSQRSYGKSAGRFRHGAGAACAYQLRSRERPARSGSVVTSDHHRSRRQRLRPNTVTLDGENFLYSVKGAGRAGARPAAGHLRRPAAGRRVGSVPGDSHRNAQGPAHAQASRTMLRQVPAPRYLSATWSSSTP
jgi:hypothetical protein